MVGIMTINGIIHYLINITPYAVVASGAMHYLTILRYKFVYVSRWPTPRKESAHTISEQIYDNKCAYTGMSSVGTYSQSTMSGW